MVDPKKLKAEQAALIEEKDAKIAELKAAKAGGSGGGGDEDTAELEAAVEKLFEENEELEELLNEKDIKIAEQELEIQVVIRPNNQDIETNLGEAERDLADTYEKLRLSEDHVESLKRDLDEVPSFDK